jgi:hypothetical protein
VELLEIGGHVGVSPECVGVVRELGVVAQKEPILPRVVHGQQDALDVLVGDIAAP